MHDDRVTVTVAEFQRISGIGHSKTYELIGDGTLKRIKVGRRTLILLASWHAFVDRQLAA